MPYLRCRCGKILAEIRDDTGAPRRPRSGGELSEMGLGPGPKVIAIRCRHCKRYAILRVEAISTLEFADSLEPDMPVALTGRPERVAHPARGREG